MNLPNRIVALDFETLGTVPQYDWPTSMSAVLMEDGCAVGEPFRIAIRPGGNARLSLGAFEAQSGELDHDRLADELRRILPEDALSPAQAFARLQSWSAERQAPNVAHGAAFDLGFYHHKLRQASLRGPCLSPVWICTLELARHVLGTDAKLTLEAVCSALAVPFETSRAHEAAYDALKAGEAYFALRAVH